MVGQLETYAGELIENIATLLGLPLAAVGPVRTTNGYGTSEMRDEHCTCRM